ncbi:MAG TPA: hypothetical protein VHE14_05455 [Solirubrobacteraceae bacterium]|nr:hypothetical protein [Solirubrobacteraceae bacterium]
MTAMRALAPAKINLSLHLGERREDDLHELVSLVQTISLADDLTLAPAPPGANDDEVVCAGVDGPNLAAAALRAYRTASGWDTPPQRLEIHKRVPIAAGLGGGSSDAAAALRLAASAAGRPGDPRLAELAPRLGADVLALLEPGLVLVAGAGERVRRLEDLEPYWIVVVPSTVRLATADVYREADRLGLARPAAELADFHAAAEAAVRPYGRLPIELLHNDLEPAALSLCPSIDGALTALREAGARHAMVSGSGPTAVGIFTEWDDEQAQAAGELHRSFPGACGARPIGARAGLVLPVDTPT